MRNFLKFLNCFTCSNEPIKKAGKVHGDPRVRNHRYESVYLLGIMENLK